MERLSYAHQLLVLEAKRDIVEIMRVAARQSLMATPEHRAEYRRLLKEIKEEYDKL